MPKISSDSMKSRIHRFMYLMLCWNAAFVIATQDGEAKLKRINSMLHTAPSGDAAATLMDMCTPKESATKYRTYYENTLSKLPTEGKVALGAAALVFLPFAVPIMAVAGAGYLNSDTRSIPKDMATELNLDQVEECMTKQFNCGQFSYVLANTDSNNFGDTALDYKKGGAPDVQKKCLEWNITTVRQIGYCGNFLAEKGTVAAAKKWVATNINVGSESKESADQRLSKHEEKLKTFYGGTNAFVTDEIAFLKNLCDDQSKLDMEWSKKCYEKALESSLLATFMKGLVVLVIVGAVGYGIYYQFFQDNEPGIDDNNNDAVDVNDLFK